MISRAGRILVILAGLFLISRCSGADEIVLKNGRVLQGEIAEESGDKIIFRMKLGKMAVARKDIESIEKKGLPEDFFEASAGIPGETPAKPAEKTEDNKIPYDFKIKASYEPQGDNVRITAAGEAALPNGSMVEIFIKRRDKFIASGKTSVIDSKFSMDLKFTKRRLFPAVYSVFAIFMPERQSPDVKVILRSNFAFGPKMRTVESSCRLYAGSLKEIVETEVEAKCRIGTTLAKLETLHAEFSDMFSAAKKKFVAREWDRWSNTWLLYLKGAQKKQDHRNAFFPKAEEGITIAVNSLLKLWQYCNLELRDPVKYNKIKNDPKARIRPEELKKLLDKRSFNELLDNIRREASMPQMDK